MTREQFMIALKDYWDIREFLEEIDEPELIGTVTRKFVHVTDRDKLICKCLADDVDRRGGAIDWRGVSDWLGNNDSYWWVYDEYTNQWEPLYGGDFQQDLECLADYLEDGCFFDDGFEEFEKSKAWA